jgi:RNA polymerase sigma factor (sigma-70 family)
MDANVCYSSSSSACNVDSLFGSWKSDNPQFKQAFATLGLERLRRLVCKITRESFPRIANEHDVDSILNEAWLRLARSLETMHPPTVKDFFRLAAHKIRHVLLDMIRKERIRQRGRIQCEGDAMGDYLSQATYDPVRLNAWTEFHERVATLEGDERQVFELRYYFEMTQAQVAELLDLHPRKVSRLWIKATDRLTAGWDGLVGGIGR